MLSLPLLQKTLRLRTAPGGGPQQVWCAVRRRWLILTPEEHVRQLLIAYLTEDLGYPKALLGAEKRASPHAARRFDLVVWGRDGAPWMLAEIKAPEVPLTEAALHQLLAYHRSIPCRYWLLCNGPTAFCADAADPTNVVWLDALPAYEL